MYLIFVPVSFSASPLLFLFHLHMSKYIMYIILYTSTPILYFYEYKKWHDFIKLKFMRWVKKNQSIILDFKKCHLFETTIYKRNNNVE